jgi:hypothetical protein
MPAIPSFNLPMAHGLRYRTILLLPEQRQRMG